MPVVADIEAMQKTSKRFYQLADEYNRTSYRCLSLVKREGVAAINKEDCEVAIGHAENETMRKAMTNILDMFDNLSDSEKRQANESIAIRDFVYNYTQGNTNLTDVNSLI